MADELRVPAPDEPTADPSGIENLAYRGRQDHDLDMDERVAKLETHMEYVREDLSELKAGQRDMTRTLAALSSALDKLPTKDDLWSWKLQWLAIALVAFATIVGGIVGGLDWIKTH